MSEARITSLSVTEVSPAYESPLYREIGGRYEGNSWLKNEPSYRCSVDLEWDGYDMPDEIKALIDRTRL